MKDKNQGKCINNILSLKIIKNLRDSQRRCILKFAYLKRKKGLYLVS